MPEPDRRCHARPVKSPVTTEIARAACGRDAAEGWLVRPGPVELTTSAEVRAGAQAVDAACDI